MKKRFAISRSVHFNEPEEKEKEGEGVAAADTAEQTAVSEEAGQPAATEE